MDPQIRLGRESLDRWNGFLDTLEDVILTILTIGLDRELNGPISKIKIALDRTFPILNKALAADPRRALVSEEYNLIKSIYVLIDSYTPENKDSLSILFRALKKKRIEVGIL